MTLADATAPAERRADAPRTNPMLVPPRVGVNAALAAIHLALQGFQLFVLPLVLLPRSPWWALLLIPLAAANNPLWSLIHETVHGSFNRNAAINRLAGRALAIAFGSPLRVLTVGHLLHHRFNRTALDRPDMFDPSRGSRAGAAIGYYYQLLVGLYVSQILAPVAFFLPRDVLERARQRFLAPDSMPGHAAAALTRPAALVEIRIDGAIIYLLLAASMACYGAWWWLVPTLLGLRAACISFLDYVYHYGTRTDELLHANNLRLPAALQAVLLNFNLHGVHHRHPQLPWHALPDAFRADGDRFDGGYGAAALRQLGGPIALAAEHRGD